MSRRSLLLVLLATCAPGLRPVTADLPLVTAKGRVVGFSAQAQILTVDTRLGARQFLFTSGTLLLLNNHTAATSDIRAGDQVTVRYDYPTREADLVHLFREQRRTGTVRSVTNTSIELRVSGAALNLTTDSLSEVELQGIPLTNRSVLIGRKATAVFEPGTTLRLLSLNARAITAKGTIASVDATARTVTLTGRTPRVYTLDPAATILRNGVAGEITSLAAGDRITLAVVREGAMRRALAVRATGSATPPQGSAAPQSGANRATGRAS